MNSVLDIINLQEIMKFNPFTLQQDDELSIGSTISCESCQSKHFEQQREV